MHEYVSRPKKGPSTAYEDQKRLIADIDRWCPTYQRTTKTGKVRQNPVTKGYDFHIPHEAIGRMNGYDGFNGLWYRTVEEDDFISYELELATRLLWVEDSLDAARALVVGWWKKHGIAYDEEKLSLAIYNADLITSDYRNARQSDKEEERMYKGNTEMAETRTKGLIYSWLRSHGASTPKQVADGINTPTQPVNRIAAGVALQRMKKAGEVERNQYGEYWVVEN
jgi:hypothetical protein